MSFVRSNSLQSGDAFVETIFLHDEPDHPSDSANRRSTCTLFLITLSRDAGHCTPRRLFDKKEQRRMENATGRISESHGSQNPRFTLVAFSSDE
jgi:hypothetical protein